MSSAATCRSGLAAAVFFVVAIALSGVLPLWLDEIIQLRETRNTTPAQLMASLPDQPGAAPLGYLTQQALLSTAGYSVRWARFPSVVFGAGTVFLVALIGAEFGLANSWIGAVVFALFPTVLRYSTESRIYSQALWFVTFATLLFILLIKNPARLLPVAYCLALIAAVYTQPYALFVAPAHIVYAALRRDRRAALVSVIALALAVAAFLPWYLWAKANWSSGIAGAGVHFVYSAKTPLMLFREAAGAGYWGSGLLLILCVLAIVGKVPRAPFLVLLIAVPVVLALAADGIFGYFVASRQIIWVLPAVAILATQAMGVNRRVALPLVLLLAVVCCWQSYRYFTAPRENWQVAADALAGEVSKGACMIVVPAEQAYSYQFFRPELAASRCPAPRAVVAFTPYATQAQRQAALSSMNQQGYARQSAYDAGKSEVNLFSR